MALPVGVTTATITFGVPVTFTGSFVRSTVSVVPSATLVHTATGTPLVNFIEDVITTEGTSGQFVLPHTDQTGFQDEAGNAYQNWYYTATITYATDKGTLPARTKTFQLTSGQTVVDLDLLSAGAPVLPYTAQTATVTSVAGKTGAVTSLDVINDSAAQTALNATYVGLIQAAKNPDLLIAGAVTLDGSDQVTSAVVQWPDGSPGTLTITSRDANGAVLAYNITYGSPVTKTFTQPTITRNAAGAATNVPQIVVS